MLNTSERVEAVLTLIKNENGGRGLTISKVCKLANVNRANLYERHPELLAEIRKACHSSPKKVSTDKNTFQVKKDELTELTTKYKALLKMALEQQAEIEWLRKLIPAQRKQRNIIK